MFDQFTRRQKARQEDIANVKIMTDKKHFDWNERYNKKYILKFARDWGLKTSRLEKAIDTIDLEERIIRNKLQKFKDKRNANSKKEEQSTTVSGDTKEN